MRVMMASTEFIPSEEAEQAAFIEWLEIKGHKFSSIPNSTFTNSWNQKRKNRAQGLRAGLPDILVIANNKLMFVEMKRIKKSVTSAEQKEWILRLNKAGVPAQVCKGAIEAIKFVEEHE